MNNEPLTSDEVHAAADRFFPLFDIVLRNMPENSTVEDTLKVMESVCALAHKMRLEPRSDDLAFGFYKNKEEKGDETI